MSLLKTRLPGLRPSVECVPARIACIVIANALSMKSFARAPVICCGSCLCSSVLRMFPTVWCMRSHIALACGFLLVVGTSLIRQPSNKSWNSGPTNSPPLSWIQRAGHEYCVSQTCDISWQCEPRFCRRCKLVLLSSKLCQSLLERWTHEVYLELGLSKVRLSQRCILWMAMNEPHVRASVHILCLQAYSVDNARTWVGRSSVANLHVQAFAAGVTCNLMEPTNGRL
jgi:hypothetical protein